MIACNFVLYAAAIYWSLIQAQFIDHLEFLGLVTNVTKTIRSDGYQCFWYWRFPGDSQHLLTTTPGADLILDGDPRVGEFYCWDQTLLTTNKLVFTYLGKLSTRHAFVWLDYSLLCLATG